jgi:hypothetical protein
VRKSEFTNWARYEHENAKKMCISISHLPVT